MIQCRSILGPVLWAAAICPALAGSAHFPITPEQIAATVTRSGMQVTPDQVGLLADVVASVAQPALKVKSIQQTGDHRLIARMECATPDQCLPFMVALRINQGQGPQLISSAEQSLAPGNAPSKFTAPLVRAGAPAILLLDGTHVHITLSVICLENGALGQTVRAATPDRRMFYTAQVTGDRLLRGRL